MTSSFSDKGRAAVILASIIFIIIYVVTEILCAFWAFTHFDFVCCWRYRISSNKRLASNKRSPLIRAAPLSIHIEISAFL